MTVLQVRVVFIKSHTLKRSRTSVLIMGGAMQDFDKSATGTSYILQIVHEIRLTQDSLLLLGDARKDCHAETRIETDLVIPKSVNSRSPRFQKTLGCLRTDQSKWIRFPHNDSDDRLKIFQVSSCTCCHSTARLMKKRTAHHSLETSALYTHRLRALRMA